MKKYGSSHLITIIVLVICHLSGVQAAETNSPWIPKIEAGAILSSADDSYEISYYDGSLSLFATDFSMEGTGPKMSIVRRHRGTKIHDNHPIGAFGDWDLEIPRLQTLVELGISSTGQVQKGEWITQATHTSAISYDRCRKMDDGVGIRYQLPWPRTRDDWWDGYQLGGVGNALEMVMVRNPVQTALPANLAASVGSAGIFPGVTKSHWLFDCLPNTTNGEPGEAFIGISPTGERYWFTHLVYQPYWNALVDIGCTRDNPCAPGQASYGPRFQRKLAALYVSRIEDRHGNFVNFQYTGDRLNTITASDGRTISIDWHPDKRLIRSITAMPSSQPRTQRYEYGISAVDSQQVLNKAVLPDGSSWQYSLDTILNVEPVQNEPYKDREFTAPYDFRTGSMVSPSGLTTQFRMAIFDRKRNGGYSSTDIHYVDTWSVSSVVKTGPGVNEAVTISYDTLPTVTDADYLSANKIDVTVTDLLGIANVFTYQNSSFPGRLVKQANSAETKSFEYMPFDGQPYPYPIGVKAESWAIPSPWSWPRGGIATIHFPLAKTQISRDGVVYTTTYGAFDFYARPTTVMETNTVDNVVKTEVTEYHDHTNLWILGQIKRRYVVTGWPNNGTTINNIVESEVEYDTKALPWKRYSFGKLDKTLSYWPDGNLKTATDGRENTISLGDYYRGVPRSIAHPATPESPSGATESATVNAHGWITSVTDENGFTTSYSYDAMGRLAGIAYPGNDTVAWTPLYREFRPLAAGEWMPPGVTAGQWREYVAQGNYAKVVYLDAMWRPVLAHEYDSTNTSGTLRSTRTAYDSNGRVSFQSYPVSDLIPGNSGMRTFYDALDRVTRVEQDSENGTVLATTTEYLSGLQVRTTNPRNQQTTTSFMAWGQPGYDLPILSQQPEGKTIQIERHPQFGWPLALTQRNAINTLSQTRRYVYDGNAQLCKTIEPETGATVTGYDAAGNLSWSASGLTGDNYANALDCSYSAANASGRVVNRSYDSRNRLSQLQFPDGRGNQIWTYTPDSLPASITTYNGAGNTTPVVNAYNYNYRRMLASESINQPGWYTWTIGYGYNADAHLASHTYPTGLVVDYAPNALGQPTKAGTYANGAQYYPNGALKQFTYGNGIVHSMTQNARQLPSRVTSSGNVLDNSYYYDANGNPEHIGNDLVHGYDPGDRWMTYDGLDRLTDAGSASFGGDHWHRFAYDALDNMTSWKLAGVKDYADYVYDANRLTSIRNTAGATVVGLAYDAQGNLSNKNGQGYEFDYGNRLRGVTGNEYYRYDGLGRRVTSWKQIDGATTLSQYSHAGQMLFSWGNLPTEKTHEHVYLAGSLIATVDHDWPSNAITAVKYQHTDALGSPVAVTNTLGQVIERNNYEPYGAIIGKPTRSGIGYTGHVMDGATGLTYMQQRYYDQSVGRFLSNDPVTADGITGANFNRYWYANNNPYAFVDPDGRIAGRVGKELSVYAAYRVAKYAINTAGDRAVKAAWAMERKMVQETGRGTRVWSPNERQELLSRGKVSGYDGDHINSEFAHPHLAGNPDNIQFLSKADHAKRHNEAGGTHVPLSGDLLDRTDSGKIGRLYDYNGYSMKHSDAYRKAKDAYLNQMVKNLMFGAMVFEYLDPFYIGDAGAGSDCPGGCSR